MGFRHSICLSVITFFMFSHSQRLDSGWIRLSGNDQGFQHFYSFTGAGPKPYPVRTEGVRHDDPTQDPLGAFVVEGDEFVHNIDGSSNDLVLGYLATKESYSRYHFSVEYRFDGSCHLNFECNNSGLLYHIREDNLWPSSIEANMYTGHPTALSGIGTSNAYSVDHTKNGWGNGGAGAKALGQNTPPEQWHRFEAIIEGGDRVTHYVNGVEGSQGENVRQNGVAINSGRIALQIEGSGIAFRNVKVRYLDSLKVWGCTDEVSEGYIAEATHDDSTCTYSGCIGQGEAEYYCTINPEAYPCTGERGYNLADISDDGSCPVNMLEGPHGLPKYDLTSGGIQLLEYEKIDGVIRNMEGEVVESIHGWGSQFFSLSNPGIYSLEAHVGGHWIGERIVRLPGWVGAN